MRATPLHGLDARAHGLGAPVVEEDACPVWRNIVPELAELFLEQVGADCDEVEPKQVVELVHLPLGGIFDSLERAPSAVEQHRLHALLLHLLCFGCPHVVDGLAQVADDVESGRECKRRPWFSWR